MAPGAEEAAAPAAALERAGAACASGHGAVDSDRGAYRELSCSTCFQQRRRSISGPTSEIGRLGAQIV